MSHLQNNNGNRIRFCNRSEVTLRVRRHFRKKKMYTYGAVALVIDESEIGCNLLSASSINARTSENNTLFLTRPRRGPRNLF